MRRRERFAADDEDAERFFAQPFDCGEEREHVPVAVAAVDLADLAIAIAGRLIDVRLDFPEQRDLLHRLRRSTGRARGTGERVLAAGRAAESDGVVEIAIDDVERERLA